MVHGCHCKVHCTQSTALQSVSISSFMLFLHMSQK
jgi:hypothetical protein